MIPAFLYIASSKGMADGTLLGVKKVNIWVPMALGKARLHWRWHHTINHGFQDGSWQGVVRKSKSHGFQSKHQHSSDGSRKGHDGVYCHILAQCSPGFGFSAVVTNRSID